jgi:hypothetical protein
MFGGVAFLLNGNLLVGVWNNSLIVRPGSVQGEIESFVRNGWDEQRPARFGTGKQGTWGAPPAGCQASQPHEGYCGIPSRPVFYPAYPRTLEGSENMAKKSKGPRKPGGAAGIEVIEDEIEHGTNDAVSEGQESEVTTETPVAARKPPRTGKHRAETTSNEQIGIGEIRKAAAFVNSIGGLEKAIALLQILKVAKEVQ